MTTYSSQGGAPSGRIGAVFRRLGRALRTAARNYAAAREIQARRIIFSRFDEHQLRDIGVDRFGTPLRSTSVDPTPPQGANDDHETRRAA
jgi:hypothetical protein